jgi:hypothetical protein
MLQSYGLDKDGRIRPVKETGGKTLYEMSTADGALQISEEQKNIFRREVQAVVKNIIGNMATEDISAIRLSLLGNILMMFRNWIPRTVDERFGGLRYNQDLNNWERGRYQYFWDGLVTGQVLPMLYQTTANLIPFINTDMTNYLTGQYENAVKNAEAKGEKFPISLEEYIELETGNIRATVKELQIILAVLGMMFAMSSDDDDETAVQRYIAKTLDRLYSELFFYANPVEFVKILKSPLPLVGVLTETMVFLKQLFAEPFTDDKKNEPGKRFLKMFPTVNGILKVEEIITDGNVDFTKN